MADPAHAIKPRRRWVRRGVFALALVFVVALGSEVYWALTARPGSGAATRGAYVELARTSQPREGGVYWSALEEAFAIEEAVRADLLERHGASPVQGWPADTQWPYDLALWGRPWVEWSDGEAALVERHCREARDALREAGYFETLGRAGASGFGLTPAQADPSGMGPLLLDFDPTMMKVDTLEFRWAGLMRLATLDTDADEIQRLLLFQLATASALSYQPVGVWRAPTAFEPLEPALLSIIESGAFDERRWESLLEALDELERGSPAIQVEYDRVVAHDVIERTYTGGGSGSGLFMPTEAKALLGQLRGLVYADSFGWVPESRFSNLMSIAYPSKREVLATCDAYHDLLIAGLALAPSERSEIEADLVQRFAALGWRYELFENVIGWDSWKHVFGVNDGGRETFEALRIMVAIEIHRARTGNPPAALDELTPILGEVPDNPRTEWPFVYWRLAAGEAPYAEGSPEIDGYRLVGGYVLEGEPRGYARRRARNALRID